MNKTGNSALLKLNFCLTFGLYLTVQIYMNKYNFNCMYLSRPEVSQMCFKIYKHKCTYECTYVTNGKNYLNIINQKFV